MKHANNLALLPEISEDLCRCGFSVKDNAFTEEVIQALTAEFEDKLLSQNFTPARVGRSFGPTLNSDIRSDVIYWLGKESLWDTIVKEMIPFFNRELFIGINDYEFHYALYKESGHYDYHFDENPNSSSQTRRLLTILLYLNQNWDENWGGKLEIENGRAFSPNWNRLIVFESSKFKHRVAPTQKLRRSLTGWLMHRTL
jgi:SM-20-related protein